MSRRRNAKNNGNQPFWESADLNTRQYNHYVNRLTELSLAMFAWKNVPKEIDIRFLEMILFSQGKILFFWEDDLEQYVVMRTNESSGRTIYDQPVNRQAYANNGYMGRFDTDNSVLIYNNLIRTPAQIDVELFAWRLANLDRIIDVNTNAQKTPVLVTVDDEKQRLMMNNLYMQYDGNQPFIFGYNGALKDTKVSALKTDAPFNATQLYELKIKYWNEALTYLGISNVSQKKERMLTDEVARIQGGTVASRYSRLESRREACKQINDMFNLDIWVDFRDDAELPENEIEEEILDDEEYFEEGEDSDDDAS